MNLIDLLKSPQDLLALRDHLGKVLKDSMDMPLKSRKLNELTAKLVGAADFNTAQAMAGKHPVAVEGEVSPFVVVDLSSGVPHIYSTIPVQGVVINNDADEVRNAKDNHVPNLLEDLNGESLACWHIKSQATSEDIEVAQHFRTGRDRLFNAYLEPTEWHGEALGAMEIPAFIRSDDGHAFTAFDAVGYFNQLDDQAINPTLELLEACDFNGDYQVDHVAEFLSSEPGQEALSGVFNYVDSINQQLKSKGSDATIGYYVEIEKASVYAWNQKRLTNKSE